MKMVEKIVGRAREMGLSQAAVERACGLSENRISKWSNGTGEPTARQLYRIARYLGCTADSLMDEDADLALPASSTAAAVTAAKMVAALGLPEDMVIRALDDLSASLKAGKRADGGPPEITPPLHAPRPGSSPGRSHRSA